jgi:hypothetical protein
MAHVNYCRNVSSGISRLVPDLSAKTGSDRLLYDIGFDRCGSFVLGDIRVKDFAL